MTLIIMIKYDFICKNLNNLCHLRSIEFLHFATKWIDESGIAKFKNRPILHFQ